MKKVICANCGKSYKISTSQYNRNKKRGSSGFYCTKQCLGEKRTKKINVSCCNCGKTFNKKQSQIRKTKNNFCSNSCSAKYNNEQRSNGYFCKYCKIKISNKYTTKKICKTCKKNRHGTYHDYTLGQLKNKYTTNNYHSVIRSYARKEYKKHKKTKKCKICGYDKRTDICHIRPVSRFNDDTKLKIVNHIDNLVALCPNHHWELDNDLISV